VEKADVYTVLIFKALYLNDLLNRHSYGSTVRAKKKSTFS